MPLPTDAPMAADCDLPDGYIVRFNALDPTDGSEVTGVVVSEVSIFGTILGSLADATGTYPPVLLRTRVSSG